MAIVNVVLAVVGGLVALLAAVVLWVRSGKPSHVMEGTKRVFTSLPSQAYVFGMAIKKSLVGKKVKSAKMPETVFVQHDIAVDSEHVAQYRDICGFDLKGSGAPLTYPYLLIFPLQGLLLVDASFPFQAMGLVHLANRIQQFGAIKTGSKVSISVQFDQTVVPHAKGYCFNVISEVYSSSAQDVLLWRCESTYLFRSRNSSLVTGVDTYASKFKENDMTDIKEDKTWTLKGDFSRRYASISGDYNPIHLYAATAKLFGFPHGCIMHGMWSVAASTASLMPDVTSPAAAKNARVVAEVYAEMKLPMYLPNKPILLQKEVSTKAAPETTQCTNVRVFELDMNMRKEKNPVPHLKGWCAWN